MTWLIGLFASPERAEAIAGDLEEEFRSRAADHGRLSARWWYVRQTLMTIPNLVIGQLRATPFAILGFGVVAVLMFNAIVGSLEWSAERVVTHYPVYHHVTAAVFWSVISAVEIYGTPVATGWITARIARDRAVTSLVVMGILVTAWVFAYMVIWAPSGVLRGLSLSEVIPRVLLRTVEAVGLMVAGAAAAHVSRSRRLSIG